LGPEVIQDPHHPPDPHSCDSILDEKVRAWENIPTWNVVVCIVWGIGAVNQDRFPRPLRKRLTRVLKEVRIASRIEIESLIIRPKASIRVVTNPSATYMKNMVVRTSAQQMPSPVKKSRRKCTIVLNLTPC